MGLTVSPVHTEDFGLPRFVTSRFSLNTGIGVTLVLRRSINFANPTYIGEIKCDPAKLWTSWDSMYARNVPVLFFCGISLQCMYSFTPQVNLLRLLAGAEVHLRNLQTQAGGKCK